MTKHVHVQLFEDVAKLFKVITVLEVGLNLVDKIVLKISLVV